MLRLDKLYRKVIGFLNREKVNYIVIGGVAAGTLGEPRVTGDVDIDLSISKKDMADFLSKAKKAGFQFDKNVCKERAKRTGTFQIKYKEFHLDFIIASTDLEREAFKRKKVIRLYNIKAYFPTPEDLILLKVISGRPLDIIDAEKVAIRWSGKLDSKYLESWAQELSDEAENLRIYNEVTRLLNKSKKG